MKDDTDSVEKLHMGKGVVLYVGAMLCLAMLGACSKGVNRNVSAFTIVLFQSFIPFLFCLIEGYKQKNHSLKTKNVVLHFVRDASGFLTFLFLFLALKSISLGDAVLLQNSAPLWVPFIIIIWLRSKVPNYIWLGVVIGFIGVALVLKPDAGIINVGSLIGVLSGIMSALAIVSLRQLVKCKEPDKRIRFYYFLFGTLIAAPFAWYYWVPLDKLDWILLTSTGVLMYVLIVLMTASFHFADSRVLATLSYFTIVFSYLIGWVVWKHVPGVLDFVGILLVIVGGCINIILEARNQKKI
jgi:drug/metabolite transporter (DMT)-like permease